MRQSLLSRIARRTVRQGQIGQTIVIMAFGFIILLAFVGIVTDVSLMFVRYTTLRRAVDAAAVAAAGQVRRTVPTAAELTAAGGNENVASQYAFARSVTNINLAARQFIEFYGLSPSNVVVDSCDTLQRKTTDPGYDPEMLKLLQCTDDFQPRKLVRVTAQLQSPTVFLRLIGWGTVTLEASAISETAVLDVVLIFDAAETMLKQTTYNDWKTVPDVNPTTQQLIYNANGTVKTVDKSLRYLPVKVNRAPNWKGDLPLSNLWGMGSDWIKPWRTLLNMTQQDIYNDATNFPEVPFTWDGTTATVVATNDSRAPRKDCRVRFYPYADTVAQRAMTWLVTPTTPIAQDLQNSYTALLRSKTWVDPADNATKPILGATENYDNRFDGFIPTYDYFGCCNDPNGDNNFNDLVCQPFKKVRDATESFLDRVDFVRGDRVAFVTFDRTAFLIDPDGNHPTSPTDPIQKSQLPMITSQANAVAALQSIVGVRAEPTYYADTDNDGKWNAFVTGGTPYTGTATGGSPITYVNRLNMTTNTWQDNTIAPDAAGYNNTRLGVLNDYPVRYNCQFDNATLQYPFSLFSSQASQADNTKYGTFGSTNPVQQLYYPYDATQLVVASRWPTPLAAMTGTPIMNPNLNLTAWNNSMKTKTAAAYQWDTKDLARQAAKPVYSYEFRAACSGNNVGAALRVGNNALLDPRTVRIGNTGAVWVMVLLGDGAAGASDPVQRNGAPISNSNPYGKVTDPPTPGSYGAYGLCPFGQPDNQMGLTTGWETSPPRCSDDGSESSNGGSRGYMGPVSRHFCTGSAVGDNNNSTIDIGKSSDCVDKYDVDDYARDWADFIGLTQLPNQSPFSTVTGIDQSRSLLQLPTIFTIGFGLDFPESGGCGGDPTKFTNINDCLGEELLRYIADVGDNNRIDTDYQQDYLNDGAINGVTADGQYKYGDRGPCEDQILTYANAEAAAAGGLFSGNNFDPLRFNPLPPKRSCGNYYNAPGGPELTKVFEDIASRMFTRITK